jgi:DNA invertase Pin-like site-specific DNA recombinase
MIRHSLAPPARRWTPWVAAALGLVVVVLTPDIAEAAQRPTLLPAAGWHGREIRAPHKSLVPRTARRWPPGWSAGAVRLGTGYVLPAGSARVRALQRMLRKLGYRPGPVDGRFGPRTAAAVGWFEYKHGLRRTRAVGSRTLALLRARASGARDVLRTAAKAETEAQAEPPSAPPPGTSPTTVAPQRTGSGTDLTSLLYGLVALVLVLIVARTVRAYRSHAPRPEPAERPQMLGYVALTREESRDGVPAAVLAAIDELCTQRGWALAKVVRDVETETGRLHERPGLFHALDLLASGRAEGLVVARLRDLSSSVADIGPLLRWIEDANASLTVIDVRLDTTTKAGRLTAGTLVEVSDWERRRGRPEAPRGGDREVAAWIATMRDGGMSLETIADVLNHHGVPPRPRSKRWRAATVEAALERAELPRARGPGE